MKKIIPIKVEKTIPQEYKFVEWKIHNVCNYDCSFCGSEHKNGSNRWFSLTEYKNYADKLIDSAEGKSFWFQFTGGEPTLFPELIKLMQYVKSKGAFISLISNGSRTLRWWNDLRDSRALDYLIVTYHTEMTNNFNHIVDVLNLFHDEPVLTECLVTHTKDTIALAFTAGTYIVNNTGASVTVKAMMIGEYDIYSFYTEEQFKKLKEFNSVQSTHKDTKVKKSLPGMNYNLNVHYDDGSIIEGIKPQVLLKNKESNFKNWQCDIGINSMRVDYDKIFRGVCGIGGPVNSLENPASIKFQDLPITCTLEKCFCNTDLIATKLNVQRDK